MRIEGGKVAVEMPRSSSRKGRRRKKEAGAPPPAVQRLFETCREVFFGCAAGVVPSPEDVGQLKAVLGELVLLVLDAKVLIFLSVSCGMPLVF